MTDVFQSFVIGDGRFDRERIEAAAYEAREGLSDEERRKANDVLLAKLDEAKRAFGPHTTRKQLLGDPYINCLVNVLVILNEPLLASVLKHRRRKPHPYEDRADLYMLALSGRGGAHTDAGGVIGAILAYDYQRGGGAGAFPSYLAQAVGHSFLENRRERRNAKQIEEKTRHAGDGEEGSWRDRHRNVPYRPAMNRELLQVVQSVIPHLPTPQQREMAAWMIDRILTTGELPLAREAAQIQRPRVSRERGRQIMEATVDSICRQIETEYPQLAEQGINGWEEFKTAFPAHRARYREK